MPTYNTKISKLPSPDTPGQVAWQFKATPTSEPVVVQRLCRDTVRLLHVRETLDGGRHLRHAGLGYGYGTVRVSHAKHSKRCFAPATITRAPSPRSPAHLSVGTSSLPALQGPEEVSVNTQVAATMHFPRQLAYTKGTDKIYVPLPPACRAQSLEREPTGQRMRSAEAPKGPKTTSVLGHSIVTSMKRPGCCFRPAWPASKAACASCTAWNKA